MAVSELLPTIRQLSQADKLRLLQLLVQELLAAETEPTDDVEPSVSPMANSKTVKTLTMAERRAFLQQPAAARQRLLAEQADALYGHYAAATEWRDLMAGDIIDD